MGGGPRLWLNGETLLSTASQHIGRRVSSLKKTVNSCPTVAQSLQEKKKLTLL